MYHIYRNHHCGIKQQNVRKCYQPTNHNELVPANEISQEEQFQSDEEHAVSENEDLEPSHTLEMEQVQEVPLQNTEGNLIYGFRGKMKRGRNRENNKRGKRRKKGKKGDQN